MISIIITAWEEPKEVNECLRRFTNQKNLESDYEILITAPDEPTRKEVIKYVRRYPKNIKFFLQPKEKGKNEMLNILMDKAKGSILIFTDGDVFVNDTAVSELFKIYNNKEVGAATGRILPRNSKDNIFGYWAHLLTHGAHKMREYRNKKKEFLECSGYLYSIRKNLIDKIPLDVAEDSIMPLIIFKKGFRIAYVPSAIGSVNYPETFSKWRKQKVRCAKSHDKLNVYGGKKIRMKTFKNEVLTGTFLALSYPRNIREFSWALLLFPTRLIVWIMTFIDTKIKGYNYGARWEKIHAGNNNK